MMKMKYIPQSHLKEEFVFTRNDKGPSLNYMGAKAYNPLQGIKCHYNWMEACSPILNPNQMLPRRCGSRVQALLHPLDLCMTKSMQYNLLAYFLVFGCSFIIMAHIYMSNIIFLVLNKTKYFIFNTWNFVFNTWHVMLILYNHINVFAFHYCSQVSTIENEILLQLHVQVFVASWASQAPKNTQAMSISKCHKLHLNSL